MRPLKRALVAGTLLFVLAACSPARQGIEGDALVEYLHDEARGVGCWVYAGSGIDCLPDSEYRSAP